MRRGRCICRWRPATAARRSARRAGLISIGRNGYRYKKAGVVLLDLHPAAAAQEGLFAPQ